VWADAVDPDASIGDLAATRSPQDAKSEQRFYEARGFRAIRFTDGTNNEKRRCRAST
jgi:hypothetical protein